MIAMTKTKPTHYFVYVGHSTQTKNKLQLEFKQYLESLQGTLIDANKLQELKDKIIAKSIELNEKHKRCTPIKIPFVELYSKKGLMITGFNFIAFHILKASYDSN